VQGVVIYPVHSETCREWRILVTAGRGNGRR
jgi:hypothetical protein